ncbi:hypothetical protein B0T14DRAFT_492484 [Immersiella caudata]|uniref:Uncharacterized protein n=1 Tax=Immersiella caudata TaxID=314043 RepID=A0AA39X2R9_9PEZI|nr:hypothetical protein B0T14DRAFT_492484 [Immersiella caudata]
MSTPSPTSPQKRPRLSLQIKAIANGPTGRTSRTLAAAVDVKSPTAFNTLSNVYATAVDRSTPVQDRPPTNALSGAKPSLRLQTQESTNTNDLKARGLQTPYLGPYLDTPQSAQPQSPAVAARDIRFPSSMTMTATPPLSAVEQTGAQNFEGASTTPLTAKPTQTPLTPGGARRRTTLPATLNKPPYTHTRSLRSILRNSPLPPLSTKSPISPRRQSVRLQEKAARRVAYNSPLCQTITTIKYTKSHVDLLSEDQTPTTPSMSENDDLLDQTMAYTGNETRDGGQTPGPFEEMRRRMAGLHASTPTTAPTTPVSAGGIRKRGAKKKEKKRRWVWTIGKEEGEDEDGSPVGVVTPPAATTPAPVVLVAMPVPKAAGVPVLAVPAPRARTRMQTQMAKVATAPIIMPPAPAAAVRATTTPEPITAVLLPEPPTPSLSVGSSNVDPVFESHADVEMSDASSTWSEDGNNAPKPDVTMGGSSDEFDTEMDTDTPIAAPKVIFQEAHQGWAPWIASSG